MTDDGARAIAIRLEAGQELSDHQVRERAWLVVVEGEAEIRCGEEVVRGGVGTLATFDPGERHAVSSASGGADPAPPRAVARRRPLPRGRDAALSSRAGADSSCGPR